MNSYLVLLPPFLALTWYALVKPLKSFLYNFVYYMQGSKLFIVEDVLDNTQLLWKYQVNGIVKIRTRQVQDKIYVFITQMWGAGVCYTQVEYHRRLDNEYRKSREYMVSQYGRIQDY